MLFDRIFRRTARSHRRGQALVEFAIILPLLALLLVMAVDAGRLFFGYVALHNAARIGADFAASHAEAWNGVPNPIEQQDIDRYELVLQQDMLSLGCDAPGTIPDPNFDPDGDGTDSFTDGSYARVTLDCDFHPLTPLAETFLGRPLNLRASADFAINRALSAGLPPPVNPPPGPSSCDPGQEQVPDLFDMQNDDAFAAWQGAGFTGSYAPVVTNQNKNDRVTSQSLPAGSCQPLNSSMLVTLN